MKKLISLFLAAITLLALPLCTSAYYYTDDNGYTFYSDMVSYDGYITDILPASPRTVTLDCVDWDGKSPLKNDTCYFVRKDITITGTFGLPESSMLIIRNDATLNIGKYGRLLSNGTIIVHTEGKLNIRTLGRLELGKNSATLLNGKLAISKGGRVINNGFIEGYASGGINVKGTLIVEDNGQIFVMNKPKVYSSGKLNGEYTIAEADAKPIYRFDELYVNEGEGVKLSSNLDGNGCVLENKNDIKNIINTFESVQYKFSGELAISGNEDKDEFYGFDASAPMTLSIFETGNKYNSPIRTRAGITRWNGILYRDGSEYPTSCYYIVNGRPDQDLFCDILYTYCEQDD